MTQLTDDEIQRYARHIVLPDFGGAGQQKLKASKVLVIGAGGLGSPVLLYLAAAGIGTIGIIDDDHVSLSNLQRQIIHNTASLGQSKVDNAHRVVNALNPHVQVKISKDRLTSENAREIIDPYNLVIDGSDNLATRYLVSDTCFYAKKVLVTGAVNRFDGSITTIKAHLKNDQGEWNPTYRCIFPEITDGFTLLTCEEAGIMGALTGVIGSLQAMEAIKEIAGLGEGLVGRLCLYDAKLAQFETIHYKWDANNPLTGENAKSVC